jgi:hypothetical protein
MLDDESAGPRYDWTQPICDDCWDERHPDRRSHRLVHTETEVCCFCGEQTVSGIYLRIDPATVPHPSLRDD